MLWASPAHNNTELQNTFIRPRRLTTKRARNPAEEQETRLKFASPARLVLFLWSLTAALTAMKSSSHRVAQRAFLRWSIPEKASERRWDAVMSPSNKSQRAEGWSLHNLSCSRVPGADLWGGWGWKKAAPEVGLALASTQQLHRNLRPEPNQTSHDHFHPDRWHPGPKVTAILFLFPSAAQHSQSRLVGPPTRRPQRCSTPMHVIFSKYAECCDSIQSTGRGQRSA